MNLESIMWWNMNEDLLLKIDNMKKFLKETDEFTTDMFSYKFEIIDMISSITEREEYKDIYIPNMKEIFQKGSLDNLLFEECITYFHWLWTAERMAPGSIRGQIEKGKFEKVLCLLEKYLMENN